VAEPPPPRPDLAQPSESSDLHVGAAMRAYRHEGVILYYNEEAPRAYEFCYEPAGDSTVPSRVAEETASGFDRAALDRDNKVDCFCVNTFKWYESRVVAVQDNDMVSGAVASGGSSPGSNMRVSCSAIAMR
jgi:hypothetical protein